MLDEYYISRGWDGEGRPSEGKLRSLGLPALADLPSRLARAACGAAAAAPRPHGPDRATAGRRPGGSVENDESAAATA